MQMEDYNIELKYLPGEQNVLADCFSRVPRMEKPAVGDRELEIIWKQKGTAINWNELKVPELKDDIFLTEISIELFLSSTDNNQTAEWDMTKLYNTRHNIKDCHEAALFDAELNKCLMNLPALQQMNKPVTR